MTELTDEQINKRIHELMGLCLHRWVYNPQTDLYFCNNICKGGSREPVYIDFTTSWKGFGLLWTWLQKHERWEELCDSQEHISHCYCGKHISTRLISPPALSRAVVEFFGRENK